MQRQRQTLSRNRSKCQPIFDRVSSSFFSGFTELQNLRPLEFRRARGSIWFPSVANSILIRRLIVRIRKVNSDLGGNAEISGGEISRARIRQRDECEADSRLKNGHLCTSLNLVDAYRDPQIRKCNRIFCKCHVRYTELFPRFWFSRTIFRRWLNRDKRIADTVSTKRLTAINFILAIDRESNHVGSSVIWAQSIILRKIIKETAALLF